MGIPQIPIKSALRASNFDIFPTWNNLPVKCKVLGGQDHKCGYCCRPAASSRSNFFTLLSISYACKDLGLIEEIILKTTAALGFNGNSFPQGV